MRTTIELDSDTGRAVEQLRREDNRGVSEAVNELIRRGMLADTKPKRYVPKTRRIGLRIDVSNVSDALDLLEGPDAR